MTELKKPSLDQRKASNPALSVWVNANAGSGKTHVLVDRLIRLMLSGVPPGRILCLTYTNAGAAEMAARLFERLGPWATLPQAGLTEALDSIGLDRPDAATLKLSRQLFSAALETPGGLKVQTIHAFCERLLQLFPVEAGITPHFQVMDEGGSREVLAAARHAVLMKAEAAPESALGRALAEITRHVQADDFDDLLNSVLDRSSIAGEVALEAAIAALRQYLSLAETDSPESVLRNLAIDKGKYAKLAAALRNGTGKDIERALLIDDVLARPEASLADLRELYLTKADAEPKKLGSIATKAVQKTLPLLEEFAALEQQRLQEGLGHLADLEHLTATRALLLFAAEVSNAYEIEKRKLGAYDFNDLVILTSRLLSERPDAAWVLFKLDGGIDHLLLDEAQDTSQAQWAIIRSLTEEFFAGEGRREKPDRTIFVVGDRKQSIFSFQGADPNLFESIHADFENRIRGSGQGFDDVDFTVSFRSAQDVLDAVDKVFAKERVANRAIHGNFAKELQHQSNRLGEKGIVELWPLVEPDDKEDGEPWTAPVDREPANSPRRRLARNIATTVKSWIGLRLIGSLNRVVEPGDILILVRSRNTFFDAMIAELRREGIPVAGADRLKLMDNLAVQDLVVLARFCTLAADDYSLACLLKSPLLEEPFSEEQLFGIAWGRGKQPLWDVMRASPHDYCCRAVAGLSRWQEESRHLPPFEFFAGVLQQSRKRFLSRLGSEAGDALNAFLDSTLNFEVDHNASLHHFLDWFTSGDIEIKRNMEQRGREVRIMTVHGAKGLEAPIVILPDTTSPPEGKKNSRVLQLDGPVKLPLWKLPKRFESHAMAKLKTSIGEARSDEHSRLLYVAMTRARDELYVCGYEGQREAHDDCWYNLISNALRAEMRDVGEGRCRMGIDPVSIVAPDPPPATETAIPPWAIAPYILQQKKRSTLKPSKLAAEFHLLEHAERGTLTHRIMQLLPEVAVTERPAFVSRMVKAAGHEISIAEEITRLLASPGFTELFAEDGLSEVPIRVDLNGSGQLITGRIDRLIVRHTEILAVDYKTDRHWPIEPANLRPEYLLQMAAYFRALKAIHPGSVIRCAILWTAAPRLMEIPDSMMENAFDHIPLLSP